MKQYKILGVLLIATSLVVGYIGINKIADSKQELNFIGIQIDASNETKKQEGYAYVVGAISIFAGGIYLLQTKR